MFSQRSRHETSLNALSRARLELTARELSYLDLTHGNPTLADLVYDEGRILRSLGDARSLRYEPNPLGLPSARQAVSGWWREQGVSVTPERVLLTASTSEAYSLLFKCLCDAGDEVLVPAPSYPLFEHLARFDEVVPLSYPLGFDGAWFIDRAELARRVGPRTRAIVLVSPNNPTGHFVKRAELDALAGFGLPLISDEVFAPYVIRKPASAAASALEMDSVLTFALSGLSKLAALPQMKLAWTSVAGPSAAVNEALERLEFLADSYLSPSTPIQLALSELLEASRSTRRDLQQRILANHAQLVAGCEGSAVSVLPVEGGWYAVLRLPSVLSEEEWALALLRDARVLIQPGYFYDFSAGTFAVLSLLTPEAEFRAGVRALVEYVTTRAT